MKEKIKEITLCDLITTSLDHIFIWYIIIIIIIIIIIVVVVVVINYISIINIIYILLIAALKREMATIPQCQKWNYNQAWSGYMIVPIQYD